MDVNVGIARAWQTHLHLLTGLFPPCPGLTRWGTFWYDQWRLHVWLRFKKSLINDIMPRSFIFFILRSTLHLVQQNKIRFWSFDTSGSGCNHTYNLLRKRVSNFSISYLSWSIYHLIDPPFLSPKKIDIFRDGHSFETLDSFSVAPEGFRIPRITWCVPAWSRISKQSCIRAAPHQSWWVEFNCTGPSSIAPLLVTQTQKN